MKIISEFRANLRKVVNRLTSGVWYPVHISPHPADGAGEAASTGPHSFLRTASYLYEKGLRIDQAKRRKKRTRLPVPVVSIGNLSVGGTGKTPLVIWICRAFIETGLRPVVLTRGYGRSGAPAGLVPLSGITAELADLFGDEPVMMSQYLAGRVWVGGDRAASGSAALARGGVDVFVLDDGFQHLGLERDLDIVLLDCRSPFGNGHLLPAGPLREPVPNLGRADAFVITHAANDLDTALLKGRLQRLFPGIPVFSCRHVLKGISLSKDGPAFPFNMFAGRRAVAFAGIAGPEGFFGQLRQAGIIICGSLSFPDHHRYTANDFSRIFRCASFNGAEFIITTEKDAVRIPSPYRDALTTTRIDIDFGADREDFSGLIIAGIGMPEPAKRGLDS